MWHRNSWSRSRLRVVVSRLIRCFFCFRCRWSAQSSHYFFSLHLKIISHFDSLKKSWKSQIEIPNSSKVISQRLEHSSVGFEISRDELLQSSLLYNILGEISILENNMQYMRKNLEISYQSIFYEKSIVKTLTCFTQNHIYSLQETS